MLRQHDAAADAEATARCFFELYRRGDLEGKLNEEKRLFARVKARARRKYGCTKTVLLALTFILFTCLVL
jgi:hypothetical protein